MKVFIVFLGLLMVGAGFTGYQGDLNRYVHMENLLKKTCEECAAGAALFLDEEEYAEGRVVFSKRKSEEYAKEYLESVVESSKSGLVKNASLSLKFKDDAVNDFSAADAEYSYDTAAIRVEITLETEDMFGSPFIEVRELKRSACYELKSL